MADRRGKATLVIVRPLPGERRKGSSLVLVCRRYRSKWWTAECMGGARKCVAGECLHAQYVARGLARCRPVPRVPSLNTENTNG